MTTGGWGSRYYYGKRCRVPDRCPDCGEGKYQPKLSSGKPNTTTLGEMLKATYTGWQGPLLCERRPRWDIPSWYGYCADCLLRYELGRLRKDWGWILSRPNVSGAEISFPFRRIGEE